MMYKELMVATLKVNGQVLRETGDTVQLPFGAEYSVFLKNMNSRRAVVTIEIDGKDALNGEELLIGANRHLDLERFLTSDMNEGRKFKFIERTAAIEDHRGIQGEDGLIRIAFKYEKPPVPIQKSVLRGMLNSSDFNNHPFYGAQGARSLDSSLIGGSVKSSTGEVPTSGMLMNSVSPQSFSANALNSPGINQSTMDCSFQDVKQNDVGITVEGSKSNQSFQRIVCGELETVEHVIVLKLSGFIANKAQEPVKAAITVKTKKYCSSCGATYKSNVDYCSKDGTYLRLQEQVKAA